MITIRKGAERGATRTDWLDSRHTFSFADYYDPKQMGFRALRVINEDRVAPGGGFPTHSHREMEIVTYVVEGALEHKDSLGNGSVIRPREIQRMSAGSGITHSEFNASHDSPVHFLQIWILPERPGRPPGYEQRQFSPAVGQFTLIAGRQGGDAIAVHQDVKVYVGIAGPHANLDYAIAASRHAWLQVVRGHVRVGALMLFPGDGVAFSDEPSFLIDAVESSEVLLFDLA